MAKDLCELQHRLGRIWKAARTKLFGQTGKQKTFWGATRLDDDPFTAET